MKVALSGLGSDKPLFGYGLHRHYETLLSLSRIRPLRMPLSLLAGMSRLRPVADRFTPALGRARKLLDLYTEGSREAAAYLAWQSVFSHGEVSRLRGGKRPTPSRFINLTVGMDPLATLSGST